MRGEVEVSINPGDLKGSYERIMKTAPRRHEVGKKYFVDTHNGVTSTKAKTNRGEEHLAVALWNRFRPGKAPIPLPNGQTLTLLDYQFPFKARQGDKGVGKVDLFGVDGVGRAWVVELKVEKNWEIDPAGALRQALGYAAMVQANMGDIRAEPAGRAIREAIPGICVMAPEAYWASAVRGGPSALAAKVTAELGVPVRLVSIAMAEGALTYGVDGKPPTLTGDVTFSLVKD
jgi:hypothetical protein